MDVKFKHPSQSELKSEFEAGRVAPLVAVLKNTSPGFTVFQNIARERYSFFLDSARLHRKTGSASYIGYRPFLIFRSKGDRITIERNGRRRSFRGDALSALTGLFNDYRAKKWTGLPYFLGGAVGFLGYELSRQLENLPSKSRDDLKLPDIFLIFVRDLIILDHATGKTLLVSNLIPGEDKDFSSAYRRAEARVARLREIVRARKASRSTGRLRIRNLRSNLSRRRFEAIVRRAKRYIEAGDIYQANLSQRFSFNFEGDCLRLYRNLRGINPSPFASFFNFGDFKIISASPERLVRLSGRRCETRPIAGTRPRGKSLRETRRFAKELILSEKERAEHIMLLDLERNDLGRVCDYDTVRVSEKMILEKYSHVIHIVSNVVGRLAKDKNRFDLLRAVFPGGTITGCPKIRCMEIIDELEGLKRGIYTGSIGYLDFNGDMDFNIVIRTLLLKDGIGYLQLGAGIVYDSVPGAEYEETLHKGEAFIEALKD
ncbi:MAG: anthranilate synthase component I family protein [Candidatus Omnitrophica bacterium]|nr:anthranilate synthase component I family protein [Candidatus Omnitrophota bacterium]